MYNYVTRIRLVCAVNVIDTNLPKEKWTNSEHPYPLNEFDAQQLTDNIDNVSEDDNIDQYWLEYYVPLDEAWYRACDLPAICIN